MTSVLKKMLPVSPDNDDLDDYDVEYSFALEYNGPPVSYDIPRVVPVDVHRIPIATTLTKASVGDASPVPVVQPIVKRGWSKEKISQESNFRCQVAKTLTAMRNSIESANCGKVDTDSREGGFDLENHDRCASRVSDKTGSSVTVGFSDIRDESNEMSGSSDVEGLNVSRQKLEGLGDVSLAETNLENPKFRTSAVSSEVSYCGGVEDVSNEAVCQGDRAPVVRFCDLPSGGTMSEGHHDDDAEDIPERPVARSDLKKGTCHRCLKGNHFTKKEVCIVCGSKYCSNCVIRAMGSMPEGRKCLPCIGFGIEESRRGSLGKCSRILKKLLSECEIERILKSELSCRANQLPPHLICVNGKPLSLSELLDLQSCENPPKKLKPGNYWYDKVSGFWGKEGEKPTQIISPQLTVGDQLRREASNGNSSVLINGREITKQERWMLQFAGIRCEGSPSYWLSDDGSYQMEGMNNVIGKIWDKTGIKLFCAALSLPVPPESQIPRNEVYGEPVGIKPNPLGHDMQYKLILVGFGQSGTSTLFKQAKILYNVPFTEDERQNVKIMIQKNLYSYVATLLEARKKFEDDYANEMKHHSEQPGPSEMSDKIYGENVYSITRRLKLFSDWLLQVNMTGNLEAIFPAATREYSPVIEELWNDKAFQATYRRRSELDSLPGVANYFLDRAAEISKVDYEPSDMDILYAEGISSTYGVASMEYSFPKSSQEDFRDLADQDDSLRYQLIRANPRSLGENCKWLEMFEDVELILFCVSLTDYDEFHEDGNGNCTNKMLAARKFFESIVCHPTSERKNFLLILNKFDMLEEKIKRVPLKCCEWFADFNPVVSHHPSRSSNSNPQLAQHAFHYVAVKFKRLFGSLTGRKLYVSCVTGLEADTVDEALRYVGEILRWEEEKAAFSKRWEEERGTISTTEWSSNSHETSTT